MTEKRYTIKPQDDLFGVVDNYSTDKICVINSIRTEIEAEWLCKDMNALNDENEQLKKTNKFLSDFRDFIGIEHQKTKDENEQLKQELKGMEELLQSYRKTIKHDAELLADATKNGYLPPLEDWEEL